MCPIVSRASCLVLSFFFEGYADHRDLHVLTHSFPTRRSSDLQAAFGGSSFSLRCGFGFALGHACMPLVDGGCRSGSADGSKRRSEEHTSELQSLMRISYAVFCLKKNTTIQIPLTGRTYVRNTDTYNHIVHRQLV